MTFFQHLKHHIAFRSADPLGAGLSEEIAAEKSEPDAITLEEYTDGDALVDQWTHVVEDVEKDPEWFDFANDEE